METKPRIRLSSALLASAALALAASAARASVLAPLDFDTLVRRADLIVRARADAVASAWTADHKQIRTVTRLTVASTMKGQAPADVEVVSPGGVVGDIAQTVHGAARFTPGEQVIVLLERLPNETRFRVAGLGLGKYRIVEDEQGTPTVVQDRTGLSMPGPDGRIAPVAPFEPIPEAAFLQRLRQALRGGTTP